MATSRVEGYYHALKNASISWKKRVKLLRYGWKNDNVYLPCKEQLLIDWLSDAVSGKKSNRAPDSDLPLLWQCLSDVLKTSKCQRASASQNVLSLKTPLLQVSIEGVLSAASNKKHACAPDVALAICTSILTSPQLSLSLTHKFDLLVQLTAGCVELCSRLNGDCEVLPQDLLRLLRLTLSSFRASQQQKANPYQVAQVVSNKLLEPMAVLCHMPNIAQTDAVQLLKSCVYAAVFDRNLVSRYELYLGLKTGTSTSTGSSLPKFIDAVFTALTRISQRKHEDADSSPMNEIVTFFSQFLLSIHKEKPRLWILLLQHLCDILNLSPLLQENSDAVNVPDHSLIILSKLIAIVAETGIYDAVVTTTTTDGGETQDKSDLHMKWFSQLSRKLLDCSYGGEGWFLCVQKLLQLDHTLLHKSRVDVIQACVSTDAEGVVEAHTQLLLTALELHEQLRQLPEFVSLLLQVIDRSSCESQLWPHRFLTALGEALSNPSPAVIIETWQSLIEEAEKHHIVGQNCKTVAVTHLLVQLLRNCQLSEDNMPSRLMAAVCDLMAKTKAFIIERLKLNEGDALMLLYTWGDVHLLLMQYSLKYPHTSSVQPVTSLPWWDLSPVFTDWCQPDLWQKALNKAKTQSLTSSYYMLLLLVQKVKALLLMSSEGRLIPSVTTSLQNVILEIFYAKPQQQTDGVTNVSQMMVMVVSESDYPVLYWRALADSLPLLTSSCSHQQLSSLSHSIIEYSCQIQPRVLIGTSVGDVCRSILSNPVIHETVPVLTALVNTACLMLHQATQSSTMLKKNKKRKSESSGPDLVLQFLETVGSESVDSKDYQPALIGACHQLSQKMSADSDSFSASSSSDMISVLQALSLLPIRALSTELQSTCFVTVLSALSCVKRDQRDDIVTACMSILIMLMEGGNALSSVMSCLKSCDLLVFIHSFCKGEKVVQAGELVCKKLTRFTCKSVSSINELLQLVSKLIGRKQQKDETLILLMVLQVTAEILSRSHLNAEVREALTELHASLNPESLLQDAITKPVSDIEQYSLRAYAAELLRLWSGQSENSLLLTILPDVYKQCCNHLLSNKDAALGLSCVVVIESICHGLQTRSEIVRTHLPRGFISSTWKMLTSVLSKQNIRPQDQFDLQQLRSHETGNHSNTPEPQSKFKSASTSNEKSENADSCNNGSSEAGAELTRKTRLVISLIFTVTDETEQKKVIQGILENIHFNKATDAPEQAIASLLSWEQITTAGADVSSLVYHSAQQMLLSIQLLVMNSHRVDVLETCFDTVTSMLSQGSALLSRSGALMALTPCMHSHVDHPDLPLAVFLRLYPRVHRVTFTLLSKHREAALEAVPSFLNVLSLLLRSLIWQARQRDEPLSDCEVNDLVTCAASMDRLCQLVATSKVEFSKVTVYIISTYTHHVQKVTLIPKVKHSLLLAVFHILGICDRYTIAQLHTVLPAGPKEIFKAMYNEFIRYYKYTGRV